jgi:hypothetical protein
LSIGGEYGSGLPAEIDDTDAGTLLSQYGAAIVHQVNLRRERVRPNLSLDAAAGAELYHKEQKRAAIQLQITNFTNRVNVLNFASLFSGTAVAVPRSVSARLQFAF